jgi:hypothetical protein
VNHRILTENRDWNFTGTQVARQDGGRVLLAAILLLAGIGAAAAPLLADLLSAAAGVLIVSLVFAAWTNARKSTGRVESTNLLEAA